MKKIVTGLLMLTLAGVAMAQPITPSQKKIQDELLAKSKQQKTTGYIMLIGGAAAVAVGSVLFVQDFDLLTETTNAGETGGILLATAGGASMIGSIFLFSASARNKREAYDIVMNIKMEKGMPLLAGNKLPHYFPALSVKVRIR